MSTITQYRPIIGETRTGPWADTRCGGTAIEPTKDFAAAREAAGITWDVKVEQAYRPNGDPIDDSWHHYRSDNGYKLGVFDGSYTPITHEQIASVADELVKLARPQGGLTITSAGELNGGRNVFFAFELGAPYSIGNDPNPISPYLTMFTSHNRTGALTLIQNDIRYGCANAANAAAFDVRTGAAQGFRIRHTRNSAERLADATDGLKKIMAWQLHTREMMEHLARQSFDDSQWEMLVRKSIPLDDQWGERKKDIRLARRDLLREIGSENNVNQEGIVGTAYGAFQAIVEWEDHFYGYHNDEQRISRTIGNGNVSGKRVAFELIKDIADRRITQADLALVA